KYRGHHEVLDAIRSVAPDRSFALTLDLGCGTGLSGALLRASTERLVGIDISEKMLQHADRKAVYDTLLCADAVTALDQHQGRPDLVVASDVLIYIGDLDPIFERVARNLEPGGLCAFTTEVAAPGLRWFLRSSGRYAHGEPYVADVLARHGLRLLAKRPFVLRYEAGEPLDGAVYLAAKPTAD